MSNNSFQKGPVQCGRARDGGSGRRAWVGWGGVSGVRTGAMAGRCDVAAAGGAGEEDALQCRGAQDAAMQAGENQREIGGAEAGGDGRETGCGGAVVDGVGEMAAVAQQDVNHAQECCDALRRGERMRWWRLLTIHDSYSN